MKHIDWEVVVMIAVMLGLGALMLLVMFAGVKTALF